MFRNRQCWDKSYLPLILGCAVTVISIYLIYFKTQDVLKDRLRERLLAIAATSSIEFSAEEINSIHGESDIHSPAMTNIVQKMRKIRNNNKDIKYIYILRRTPNAFSKLEFVADADTLATPEEVDYNGNGVLEEDEIPPQPGDEYDASDDPILNIAFNGPVAASDFGTDQWGTFISGFSPILDDQSNAVAILGVDVTVNDFYMIVRSMLIPLICLAVVLLLLLTIQTVSIMRIWVARVELVQELDRQKDELLSIVSHQLATPVSSVKWYLEMLLDGDVGTLSKDQQEYLGTMQSVTHDLSDLVSMILDVSRIQLGKMKVDRQELDLNVFFKEILSVIEPKAKEKHQQFIVKIDDNLPKAMLDKRLTRMTIENLLSNAVKYTPAEGKVSFVVSRQDEKVHVEVKDTGVGIPEKDKEKIFGKLFRASNTGSIEGNGFGLYVAKGAIEAQGGKIWFESKENEGTKFFVDLPVPRN